jgi:hypothetical protein
MKIDFIKIKAYLVVGSQNEEDKDDEQNATPEQEG